MAVAYSGYFKFCYMNFPSIVTETSGSNLPLFVQTRLFFLNILFGKLPVTRKLHSTVDVIKNLKSWGKDLVYSEIMCSSQK